MDASRSGSGLPRPRKKPTQSRAVFTVQTIYDGFVRIWRRDGPAAATTRAIAAETGYSVVGTLYDYFPNRTALLAGCYQHCIERLCEQMVTADTARTDAAWPSRLAEIVQYLYGHHPESPYFDREMLLWEPHIANPGRQQHVFETCSACVHEDRCTAHRLTPSARPSLE